jgi:hypothetical protein
VSPVAIELVFATLWHMWLAVVWFADSRIAREAVDTRFAPLSHRVVLAVLSEANERILQF